MKKMTFLVTLIVILGVMGSLSAFSNADYYSEQSLQQAIKLQERVQKDIEKYSGIEPILVEELQGNYLSEEDSFIILADNLPFDFTMTQLSQLKNRL